MNSHPSLLFVYGTLRRKSVHPMARFLAERAAYLGRAKMRGRLYDLGRYPGMTPAELSDDWVHGELYQLHAPEETLDALDRYEGCPLPGEPALFERAVGEAVTETGESRSVWVYWYRGEVSAERRIRSGDYVSVMKRQ
jgi:gamma-glutamylcyclotransferase (GGCT)/AIG2-like uncharacterized protein YtfP